MKDAALLVIDIQCGAFDGVRVPPVDRPDTFIGSATTLIDAARAGGTPVVFVQHCDVAGDAFEEGSPHGALHAALAPRPGEAVVRKYVSSAFSGTQLGTLLAAAGAKHLVLCGLQSEFCVSNTAKDALVHGFEVVIARDGHRTWPSNGETAAAISERVNAELQSRGATLATTAALAARLRAGAA